MSGSGSGRDVVVAQARSSGSWIVAHQLGPDGIKSSESGDVIIGNRIANIAGLGRDQSGGWIHRARRDGAGATRVVDLAKIDGPSQCIGSLLRAKQFGKVAGAEIGIRNGEGRICGSSQGESFEETEDEGLLSLPVEPWNIQRTACRATILIPVEALFRQAVVIVKPEIRVEGGIAVELIDVAMVCVRSRLGDYIDDIAGAPSVLRREGVVLDLEFLD